MLRSSLIILIACLTSGSGSLFGQDSRTIGGPVELFELDEGNDFNSNDFNSFVPPARVEPAWTAPKISTPPTAMPETGPAMIRPEGGSVGHVVPSAIDNRQIDHQVNLSPYFERAELYRGQPQTNEGPLAFKTWWSKDIENPIGLEKAFKAISLDVAIAESLIHSPQVQVTAADPNIRQTLLVEEAAKFDWAAFWETKYDSLNDPVGNTLTTGNNDNRFRQKEWYSQGGVRKRNSYGGELELSQRLGYLDNNSRFLVPPDQGSSRLSLNYRQPLWKGRGQYVAESLIVLARIDHQLANDQFRDSLQDHLVAVAESYWELVRARAELVQRLRLFSRADEVLTQLKGRAEVDVLDRQLFRARSAVESRRAEITRAITSIKNAQSRLRLLVNSPELLQQVNAELTPMDSSLGDMPPVDLADAIATAMIHRPDIAGALRELRSANVRLGVSKNEVLPKLDLLIGTYVAGLDDESGILRSWANQFQEGGPGFNVGVEFEVPIGNRAAKARQERREWELHQAMQQFRLTVETALNEVEVAVREVNTSRQEMRGRYQSMTAAETERAYLVDRWQTLPGIDDSVTLLLEDLLDSQERLANEENSFTRAQFDYAMATVRLKQAMGTLLQIDAP